MLNTIKNKCHTFFNGHHASSAAEDYLAMSEWCQQHTIQHDIYGEGELIANFERKVADLLGFEKGLFIITGTLNQTTLLQLACHHRKLDTVAMHHSAHILKHEQQGYQFQKRFNVLPIGDYYKSWDVTHLKEIKDEIGAVLYELPMREIGGQLPSWDMLVAIKEYCKARNIHLHMDGARLWETQPFYKKSYADIADGFDSVYVSLYKGIGGLGGSLLVGSEEMISKVSLWVKRQGGNVATRSPYIVSAAMKFDLQLEKMPSYFKRTEELYELLKDFPNLAPNPNRPQTNMLHLHLPISCEDAVTIRDKIANKHGIYCFDTVQSTHLVNHCYFEWYVGDCLLNMSNDLLYKSLRLLSDEVSQTVSK